MRRQQRRSFWPLFFCRLAQKRRCRFCFLSTSSSATPFVLSFCTSTRNRQRRRDVFVHLKIKKRGIGCLDWPKGGPTIGDRTQTTWKQGRSSGGKKKRAPQVGGVAATQLAIFSLLSIVANRITTFGGWGRAFLP